MQGVFQTSPDGVTWTDAVSGTATPVANLTAGAEIFRVQPPPGMLRYWRVVFRVATAALTGGTFDAYMANTIQRNVSRASGFAVS